MRASILEIYIQYTYLGLFYNCKHIETVTTYHTRNGVLRGAYNMHGLWCEFFVTLSLNAK